MSSPLGQNGRQKQLSGFSGQSSDVWAGDSPGHYLVYSKARTEKTRGKTRLGASIRPFAPRPTNVRSGQSELNHMNLLYQGPSVSNAGNSFQSHVSLTVLPTLWVGLYWNRNQLLSEGYSPLTRTQTTHVILSQTTPGPNGSASLKAVWWQKSSQRLGASSFTHACHWLSSFTTTQNASPSGHMSFLLCSPPFSSVSLSPVFAYHPPNTDIAISPSHVILWDSHSL